MTEAIDRLSDAESSVALFFKSLAPEEFTLRVGSAWTPAEHLSHLNTAVSAVARGFAISPWILRIRFGRPRHESRTYPQIRDVYRTKLAGGAVARGGFIPSPENLTPENCEERRTVLLARWHRVNDRLFQALRNWSDADLDRVQLPHPLLGKLTAREMLYFTSYHAYHHIAAAKGRLPDATGRFDAEAASL